jgi:myo-inositol-1(or 4)-monophosphatase
MLDFPGLHKQVESIIARADKELIDAFGGKHRVSEKIGLASQASLVSEVDEKVDALFRTELSALFPDYGFVTEEGTQEAIKEFNWIIDPLDGTTNYLSGFPFFGISVALWQGNRPVYGCLSLPMSGQKMYGWENGGTFLNGEKFVADNISTRTKPVVLLAPVAQPVEHGQVIEAISKATTGPRDFGCCVFQGFETIAGKADASVMYELSLWDIGALVLLAKEAGLAVEYVSPLPDLKSGDPKSYAHTVVIGRSQYVEKLATALKTVAGI